MPTIVPAADENVHPNQWQYETPAPSKSHHPMQPSSSALRSNRFNVKQSSTTTKKKIRFRENAPHISGIEIRPTKSLHHQGGRSNIPSIHFKNGLQGGLLHLAQTYHPPPPQTSSSQESQFQRTNLSQTHYETKQSLSYSNYMNHLLSPHSFLTSSNYDDSGTTTTSSSAHSELLLYQSHSTEVHTALTLYNNSRTMTKIRHTIESSVGKGRLLFRSDRDWKDVQMKQELMTLLLYYDGRWLGLGLGVVLGIWDGWMVSFVVVVGLIVACCSVLLMFVMDKGSLLYSIYF